MRDSIGARRRRLPSRRVKAGHSGTNRPLVYIFLTSPVSPSIIRRIFFFLRFRFTTGTTRYLDRLMINAVRSRAQISCMGEEKALHVDRAVGIILVHVLKLMNEETEGKEGAWIMVAASSSLFPPTSWSPPLRLYLRRVRPWRSLSALVSMILLLLSSRLIRIFNRKLNSPKQFNGRCCTGEDLWVWRGHGLA